MAYVDWSMTGKHLKSCNCAYGCPCDFEAPPTYGPCDGVIAMDIGEGHFGDVSLDGLRWAGLAHWPGPLHEGNGTMQAIIDQRADDEQRGALLTILSGKEQVEGTLFQILSVVAPNVLKPQFLPIKFEFDLEERTARLAIPGILDSTTEPIRNPVTGAEHRIRVDIPDGFEYREAEVASSTSKSTGEIEFEFAGRHSSLAHVGYNQQGVI